MINISNTGVKNKWSVGPWAGGGYQCRIQLYQFKDTNVANLYIQVYLILYTSVSI